MKISAAIRDAWKVYAGHFGATLKFLAVEACMTLTAFTPLLFLTNDKLKWLALLAVPFYLLLVLWARVNAAAAMRDAFGEGSLFSYRLAEPGSYGRKLLYGLKRGLMLLIWAAPMIAFLVTAVVHFYGNTDVFTLMRAIKSFGGGDVVTGALYLVLILIATMILLMIGCAFHSGDRHAFVRDNPRLVRGHHGKIILSWLCALLTLLPVIIAAAAVVVYYLPILKDYISNFGATDKSMPDARPAVIILVAGAVLTVPLLPLRSLIPAAFVNGLEKE